MQVIVQVSPEVAQVLRGESSPTPETQTLSEMAKDLGVSLEPLHPGVDDPLLARFFTFQLPDRAASERAFERLLRLKGVEAAYAKPPDEMP
jgi:transcriptional regulator with XRE-family HTH domain